jgi:hypothetical protein
MLNFDICRKKESLPCQQAEKALFIEVGTFYSDTTSNSSSVE